MEFLRQQDEKVCVNTIDDAGAMGTIKEVQDSKIFNMLISDLMQHIGELSDESFKIFTQENSQAHLDLKFRVACILSKFSSKDFDITSEQLEEFDPNEEKYGISVELLEVSEIFFNILESHNEDLDYESIDQLKKMFFMIDPTIAEGILAKNQQLLLQE